MKAVVALAFLLGTASAFAPAMRANVRSMKSVRFAEEAPATTEEEAAPEPVPEPPKMSKALPFMQQPAALDGTMAGDVGFDPFGFTELFPLEWLREAEIKHGRIAQLAVVGFAATDLGFRLPGEVHQVSSILAHDAALKYGAMQQLFLWITVAEVVSAVGVFQMLDGSGRQPGDFGIDPYKLKGNEKKKADMELKEITHCRLAMLAFSGMVTQAVLTQGPFPYTS